MDAFIARQPIFDRDLSVFGYEILFRSGTENVFKGEDGEAASAQVVESTLHTFGVSSLSQGRKSFINMTPGLIIQGTAALLPKDATVVEIDGSVAPTSELVESCTAMKKKGFLVAIDNYRGRAEIEPLVAVADILKVDFQNTDADGRRACVTRHGPRGVKLLASKVESRSEYADAVQLGYHLYQGFFFAKPELITRRTIPPYKLNYLQILQEVNKPNVDFEGLEQILRRDVSLSLKLLRYINSAMFGLTGKVDSLKKALMMLGLELLKKWVSLLSIASMGEDKPQELVMTSLARARFCEEFGAAAGMKDNAFDLFMIGMVSCLDAILDQPMTDLVKELPLSDAARDALLGTPTRLSKVLRIIRAYERADWHQIAALMDGMPTEVRKIPEIYRESLSWAHQIFQVS